MTEAERVEALGNELFAKVQAAQGYFFVSDGEFFKTTAEFFDMVRGRLLYGHRACRQMRAFLKKYGELSPETIVLYGKEK